ncbi:ZmpA/ZmpB/ZmpC family metallo-endopeptidase [Streptococcus caprae]|uniref:ZmpA/ZmpB/ZmpC family metallo-endopeptidase n=1 Tax=Streptococcus caprae TaxID=1640501 RepID=A0ABV8CW89_9STRE
MNWREKQLRFSIRKLKIAVASTVIGMSAFGVAQPLVHALENGQIQTSSSFDYHYVLESELTNQEKKLIQQELPTKSVGAYDSYYMVYRPTNTLPATGSLDNGLMIGAGISLLLVGVSLVSRKKKPIVTSIILLSTTGAISVSALGGGALASYDETFTMQVGQTIPETIKTIPNHEFIGYILVDEPDATTTQGTRDDSTSSVSQAIPATTEEESTSTTAVTTEATSSSTTTATTETTTSSTATVSASTTETTTLPSTTETTTTTEAKTEPVISTVIQEIPYETIYQDDPTVPVGTETVSQLGVVGQKRLTYTDGKLTSEEIVRQPISQIITRGTKETPQPVETKTTEIVAFETEIHTDDTLALGEEVIVQAGNNGLRQNTYLDGRLVSSEIIQEPVKQIIKRGTKSSDPTTPVETTTTESVDFDTEYLADDTLPLGEEVVVQAGVAGVRQNTYLDGQLVSSQMIQEPLKQIIRRGTKVEPETTIVQVAVPYSTTYQDDSTLPEGQEKEVQAGQDGLVEQTVQDGKVISEKTIKEAVPRIVAKGTKKNTTTPVEGTEVVTEAVEIAPTETKQDDDTLWLGETETIQGTVGEKTITTTYKTIDGVRQPNPNVTETVTKEATPTIIKVGTKPIEGTETVTSKEIVAHGTKTIEDPNQYTDYKSVVEGTDGEVEVTTVYKTIKGVRQANPTVSRKTTKEAVDTVITIGTKVKEAEKQTPKAVKQTVKIGETPKAEASIDSTNLTNVASYSWATQPSTASAGQALKGQVLVTYTDGSTDLVDVTIDVVANKEKPSLSLASLVENDDDRSITLNYDLTDPTSSYTGATIEVIDKTTGAVVKTLSLTSFDDFDLSGLDWFVPYTLRTTLKYDLGQGEQSEVISEVPFELDYKHVEVKHVTTADLYLKQDDGSYVKQDEMTEITNPVSDYYVKITSTEQKDIYLAVSSITEDTYNGKAAYKVVATSPELIQYKGVSDENQADFTFYTKKFLPSSGGKYRTFEDLVTAITANPTGTFEIDADLDASKYTLASGATSYIAGNFTGTLLGNNNAISGIVAPLFENLTGAFVIKDLDLKEVNITNTQNFGALARETTGVAGSSLIKNVAVQGTLTGDRAIGGLVYRARDTKFEQVEFDGTIKTTTYYNYNFTGGIVGYLDKNSTIDGAKVNVEITADASNNPQVFRVGSVVGAADTNTKVADGTIRNVYARGSVTNTGQESAQVGGILGTTNANATLRNAVSAVNVTNGRSAIGTVGSANSMDNTVAIVDTVTASSNNAPTTKTSAEAQALVDAMKLTVTLEDSKVNYAKYDVDYSVVSAYEAANTLKYKNTEKLLPLYNKEFIVHQGNLITSGKLATTEILEVVPMSDDKVVSDYFGDKSKINKLMVHYADGSVEYLKLTYKEDFKNTAIAEYTIDGTDLIYTPNQMTTNYQTIVNQVKASLAALDYYSETNLTKLGKDKGSETVADLMDKLFLKESYAEVKANLDKILPSVLATSNIIATANQDLAKYVEDNKELLMLGLAYVNRWYNIDFETFNAKDLMLYHQDFYGEPVDTLEWLVGLAKKGYTNIQPVNNVTTYVNNFKANSGKASLFELLTDFRKTFTNYASDSEWFKATSKAYITETVSKERPDVDVSAYNRMVKTASEQNGILPLLTADEGIYIISNMTSLTYGMFDRYFDVDGLKTSDPTKYASEISRVKALVDNASTRQADFFDMWYRMNPEGKREQLIRVLPAWEAYTDSTGTYLSRYGYTNTNEAVQDFFGPIVGDLPSGSLTQKRGYHTKDSAGAMAWGNVTYLLNSSLLTNYGLSLFSHETVHNLDSNFFLGGFGRRTGAGAEYYPTGLLQAPESAGAATSILALNTMFDYTASADATNRYQAVSPERFKTIEDLQEYMHGSFDVTYLMDYAEANSVIALGDAAKKAFFMKLENVYEASGTNANATAKNVYSSLTDEEAAKLTSWTSLVDESIIGRRDYYSGTGDQTLNHNGYYRIGLFTPFYSALTNENGIPGDISFRRMAWELLAAKGYEDGFLPYVSNKLADEATAQGSTIYSSWYKKDVALPTDKIIFDSVFGSDYTDWVAFKKAMFQERIDKASTLKPVTITYLGSEVTIDSFTKLQELMNAAVKYDYDKGFAANNNSSRVRVLKGLIYNAYIRQTNDFENSIFGS